MVFGTIVFLCNALFNHSRVGALRSGAGSFVGKLECFQGADACDVVVFRFERVEAEARPQLELHESVGPLRRFDEVDSLLERGCVAELGEAIVNERLHFNRHDRTSHRLLT